MYLLFNSIGSSEISAQKFWISSLSFCFVDFERFSIVSLEIKLETTEFVFAFTLFYTLNADLWNQKFSLELRFVMQDDKLKVK